MSDVAAVQNDTASVRSRAGLASDEGPSDEAISAAIDGFAEQLEYWFTRVIAGSVSKYRIVIIRRINTFIRPIEFEGLSATECTKRLVTDYVNRNFVTAGGWAIEKMAIAIGSGGSKAAAKGIDLHRIDDKGNHHLYVIKSGKVTRNSDILAKLKQHAREAERLLKQGGAKISVFANYAIAAGATSSTFEDGIYRPSSGTFWSEVTGLEEAKAIALVLEIARTSGLRVARNTGAHIAALETLVRTYIQKPDDPEKVDWRFLFKVTMAEKKTWDAEDRERHKRAMTALKESGYDLPAKPGRAKAAKANVAPAARKSTKSKKKKVGSATVT